MKIYVLILLLCSFLMTACNDTGSVVIKNGVVVSGNVIQGSGNIISEERPAPTFSTIRLESSGDLYIEQKKGTTGIRVEADDNLMSSIITRVSGDELILSIKPGTYSNTNIKYYVTVNDLEQLIISSSGSTDIKALDQPNLSILIEGSGDVNIGQLTTSTFNLTINGSSKCAVKSGTVTRQLIAINGSGDIYNGTLLSSTTSIDISGSGTAHVNVSDKLSVTINGSGDVTYEGNPKLEQEINGSGEIHKN